MDVVFAEGVRSKMVVRAQQMLASALQHNHAWLKVQDVHWEVVAVILHSPEEHLMVSFGLRTEGDQKIRLHFGATPEGNPAPIEHITAMANDGFQEARLFTQIMNQAETALQEITNHQTPNTLH